MPLAAVHEFRIAHTDTQTHRHTDTHTDTQTHRHTDTDTDTDTHIDVHSLMLARMGECVMCHDLGGADNRPSQTRRF